ncbi:OmpA family protein [Vibrio fujianensis]|uniref:MotY family protein n=1 Tax=Vibrio fujianensis TaxID=1974215 RepID=UPI000C1658A2|nr:OmpA family protein [Vibrio fujianensis]
MTFYGLKNSNKAYLNIFSKSSNNQKYQKMKNFFTLFFAAYLLFFSMILYASENKINIPMDLSDWSFQGSQLECNLIHSEVPQGKFYFRSVSNSDISFVAKVSGNDKWSQAELQSIQAPWQRDSKILVIDTLEPKKHQTTFRFNQRIVELLGDIQHGRWIQLSFTGNQGSMTLIVPTIHSQSSLELFNHCRSELPKMTFAQARDVVLWFASGQIALSPDQVQQLDALSSYINKDSRISRILIDGYTDNLGSSASNLVVARKRAETVAQALIQLGVDNTLIEIRAHGSRYPIANNQTVGGRAKNRRITLRLVKGNEDVVPYDQHDTQMIKGNG